MTNLAEKVQQEADRCVRCGLCLPHCPTYQQAEEEGESPRGRIALWQGLAAGQLPLTAATQTYLDHCLTCRACEAVCPAEVAYGKLLVDGRALQKKLASPVKKNKAYWLKKSIAFFIRHPKILGILKTFFPFFVSHLKTSPLPRENSKKNNKVDRGRGLGRGEEPVLLLPGCIHRALDPQTLVDSKTLLQACGYHVEIPTNFQCCGAWHAHSGEKLIAEQLQQKNQQLFQEKNVDAILSTATGCTPNLQAAAVQVKDITDFLLKSEKCASLLFNALPQKAMVHVPCSQRHVLHQVNTTWQLLQRIPNLILLPVASPHCCGGAGTYFLEFPTQAKALAKTIVQEAKQHQPDIFITSNIGCALHLQQQLHEAGIKVPVLHPVNLLVQQLANT